MIVGRRQAGTKEPVLEAEVDPLVVVPVRVVLLALSEAFGLGDDQGMLHDVHELHMVTHFPRRDLDH